MPDPVPIVSLPQATRVRRLVFAYDFLALALLVLLVWWYFANHWWSISKAIPAVLQGLPIYTVWFGALGGIVISLKGIYDHGPSDWQDRFNLWHIGRPFSGGIAGGITYLLFLAVSKSQPSEPISLAAAFIMGTQEKRFFNFLSQVAGLIVSVPGDNEAALAVTAVQPTQGAEGTQLTILGQGFDTSAVVQVGDNRLADVSVNKDGTKITGTAPAGAGQVALLVINPDGTARAVTAAFTYQAVSPASLSFGRQQIGTTSAAQTVTFTNTGTAQATVTGVAIGGANADNFATAANHCANMLLAVSANCTVDVAFVPLAPTGEKNATLTITTNAGGTYTVTLSGMATA